LEVAANTEKPFSVSAIKLELVQSHFTVWLADNAYICEWTYFATLTLMLRHQNSVQNKNKKAEA